MLRPTHVLLGCTLAVTGCEKVGIGPSDFDATLTVRVPDRGFGNYQTFAMPEQVADLSSAIDGGMSVGSQFDRTITDSVAQEMADAGWTRVADPDEADVFIINGIVSTDYWLLYDYWFGYYPYSIWYPPYPVSVNFTAGTIVTVMLRPDELETIDGIERVPALWLSVNTGLARSSTETNRVVIEGAFRQSFRQSDYLVVGDPVDPVFGLDAPLPPPPDAGPGTTTTTGTTDGDGSDTDASTGTGG